MKRLLVLLIFLSLCACMPPPLTLVPVDTAVALTMAAMPRTDTPTPAPTQPPPTPTIVETTPSPEIDLAAPGAYCLPTDTQRVRALVTRVLDGKTIEVATENESFLVRYIGLNAPGIAPLIEWQGPQAIGTNERLVGGKYVTLIQDISDKDAEGYYLRYVMVDNIFVNYDMIRLGMARAVNIPPDEACKDSFLAAELEAQANTVGVWLPTPVPTFTLTLTPTITRTPAPTTVPPCNCYGRRLTCNNFFSQAHAQACFNYCRSQGLGDIFGLDKNRNGVACEGSR